MSGVDCTCRSVSLCAGWRLEGRRGRDRKGKDSIAVTLLLHSSSVFNSAESALVPRVILCFVVVKVCQYSHGTKPLTFLRPDLY